MSADEQGAQIAQRSLDEQTGWADAYRDDGTVRSPEALRSYLGRATTTSPRGTHLDDLDSEP